MTDKDASVRSTSSAFSTNHQALPTTTGGMLPGGLVPKSDLTTSTKESIQEKEWRRVLASRRTAKEFRQRRMGLFVELSNEIERLTLENRSFFEVNRQLRAQTQMLKQQLMLVRRVNAVSHRHQQQQQQYMLLQAVQEQQQTVRRVFHKKEQLLAASTTDNCDMAMQGADQAEIVPTSSNSMRTASSSESLSTSNTHLESFDVLSEECKSFLLETGFLDTW